VKTLRQNRGAAAETRAAEYLAGLGWRVIARNVELGGVEVDVLAVDPGPPSAVVVVEVRSVRSSAFGSPEERIDRAKVSRLYRALGALRELEGLVTDAAGCRVDLVIVDSRDDKQEIRHLRAIEPP
jgi:putative endonuclease